MKESIPQWSGKNLKGRSVVLDAKCKTGDGFSEIFVNTANRNDSKVSKLMELFIKDDAYDTKNFPVTSKIKSRFKLEEGERKEMNETLEKIIKEEKKESRKRGIELGEKRGAENEKIRMAKDMKKEGLAYSLIAKLTGLSEKKILAL